MFPFSLCLDLGYPHPDYLLPLLTSRQLAEWEAFYLVTSGRVKPTPPAAPPEVLAAQIDALLSRAG